MELVLWGHTSPVVRQARCTLDKFRRRLRGIVKRILVDASGRLELGGGKPLNDHHRGVTNGAAERRLRLG